MSYYIYLDKRHDGSFSNRGSEVAVSVAHAPTPNVLFEKRVSSHRTLTMVTLTSPSSCPKQNEEKKHSLVPVSNATVALESERSVRV